MGGYYFFSESNRTAYWAASDNAWHAGPRLAQVVVETEADLLAGHLQIVGGAFLGVTNHNQRLVECPSCLAWDKQVNGTPWQAGVPVVVQANDMVTVSETIVGHNFSLQEGWDAAKLELVDYQAGDGVVVAGADSLEWQVPYGEPAPHTLTQTFRVLPGTWTRDDSRRVALVQRRAGRRQAGAVAGGAGELPAIPAARCQRAVALDNLPGSLQLPGRSGSVGAMLRPYGVSRKVRRTHWPSSGRKRHFSGWCRPDSTVTICLPLQGRPGTSTRPILSVYH